MTTNIAWAMPLEYVKGTGEPDHDLAQVPFEPAFNGRSLPTEDGGTRTTDPVVT